jgi:hypothetical protein
VSPVIAVPVLVAHDVVEENADVPETIVPLSVTPVASLSSNAPVLDGKPVVYVGHLQS